MFEDSEKIVDANLTIAVDVFFGSVFMAEAPSLNHAQEVIEVNIAIFIDVFMLPSLAAIADVFARDAIAKVKTITTITNLSGRPNAVSLETTGASLWWASWLDVVTANPPTFTRTGIAIATSTPVTCVGIAVVPIEPDN